MKNIRRETRLRGLLTAVGLAILAANAVTAQAAENDADFTFRRVAPPSSSVKRLITVQVEVTPPPASGEKLHSDRSSEVAGIEPLGPVYNTSSSLDQDMFWAYLSPNRGPDRLAEAARLVQTLSGSTSVREAVSEASIREIGIRYGSAVSAAARGKRVSPALVLAVIMVESSGRSEAVSPAGAAGLMQLMPATAARFQVRDRLDPNESIRGGVEYLQWLLDEFDGDAVLALAGYNSGEKAVRRHGGVPPYAETRAYVPKVVAAWQAASGLCTTPQGSASDRCELDTYAVAGR